MYSNHQELFYSRKADFRSMIWIICWAIFSFDSIKSKQNLYFRRFKVVTPWQVTRLIVTKLRQKNFWIWDCFSFFFLYVHHQDCTSDPYWIPIWFLARLYWIGRRMMPDSMYFSFLVVLVSCIILAARLTRLLLIWNSWYSHFSSSLRSFGRRIIILYNWVRTMMM